MSLGPHRPRKPRTLVYLKFIAGFLILALAFSTERCTSRVWAQDQADSKAEKDADDDKVPPPEDIDLVTDDGLQMKATYYRGTRGRESIPVILLHGAKGSRKDFSKEDGLAAFLREKLGCAVIVPDLRGHGESTKIKINERRTEDLKGKKLQPPQIAAMVTQDLRAVKDFLWKENNEKHLNIDKLTVIGVDLGAALAISYAAYDASGYELRIPKYGPLKLGRFVKVVVLISPAVNISGLRTLQVLQKYPEVSRDLPVMIVVGNKGKEQFSEAEKLNSLLKKARPREDDLKIELRTVLFLSKIDTTLQGAELLAQPSLNVPEKILYYMTLRLVKNPDAKDYVWKERKLPHE
jgi:pimeloyl-ACP methyl ester carboxylesterase